MGIVKELNEAYVNHVSALTYNNKIYAAITKTANGTTNLLILRKYLDPKLAAKFTDGWEKVYELAEKDEGKFGYCDLSFMPDGSLFLALSNRKTTGEQVFAEAILPKVDVPLNEATGAPVDLSKVQAAIKNLEVTTTSLKSVVENVGKQANLLDNRVKSLEQRTSASPASVDELVKNTLNNNSPLSHYIWQKALDAAYTEFTKLEQRLTAIENKQP